MKPAGLLSGFALMLLAACSSPGPVQSSVAPGSDRDSHGCIPSVGYAWCTRIRQCVRPWELARKHAFENTTPAFDAFCKADPKAD